MSRRAHNWDTQRAISNRRGSDADYDPREPRRSHVDARPEPSYYGPNFQNVQRGLSSSIAYGDIQHPPVPDPYVKRPNPWPREVVDDYLHYKRTETSYRRAKKEYGRDNLAGSSKKDPQYDIKMSEAYDLAADARSSANGVAAARSGFAHKYPTSYEDPHRIAAHEGEAEKYKRTAREYSGKQKTIYSKWLAE